MYLDEKKILIQIYRWFSFYEKNSTLESQLKILSRNISIDSGLEKVFGIDDYLKKVDLIPENWESVYNILDYEIESRKNGSYIVDILVEYDNLGVKDDLRTTFKYIFSLNYEKKGKDKMFMPLIQSVRVSTLGIHDHILEKCKNKILASLNYFYLLMDKNDKEVECFKEILSKSFNLDFQGKNIDLFKNLKKYCISNSKEYKSLDHRIEDIEVLEINKFQYKVQLIISLKKIDRRDNLSEKEFYTDIELEDWGSDLLKIVSLKNKD
ncbi:hypothetical protein NRK67_12925 [Fusobacteria bacterium ZRK30]|nr:hypothetical protein NRK67_12925 [Fusobacteria bacterium ZRK30]